MDNRVKELRLEKGLKQDELASKINVSQQTISRIENGETSLPADLLIHLSRFFHVSADYILKLSETRMTEEYRIETERLAERNMDVLRTYEMLGRENQKLIFRLMEQLGEQPKNKK